MHKISFKELFSFCVFLSCFAFPGFGDTLILQTSKNSSIISVIIGFLLGLIPIFLIIYIFKQTKDQNIFELNKKRFKFLGHILNLLLVIGVIYIIGVNVWNIIDFTISQFLTRTSYYLLVIIMTLLVIIAIIKKTEVIGRTCLVLLFFFLGTFILSAIFLIPKVEIENYLPVFDVSKTKLIKSSLMYPSFAVLPFISLLFIKSDNIDNDKKINKSIIFGYVLGSVVVISFILLVIGVFGIDMSILFTYPEYTLFKKVQAFDFIERIENIISSLIFIASFSSISLLFSFVTHYIKDLVKIKKDKTYNITSVIICLGIAFISIYLFINYPIIKLYTKYYLISSFLYIVLLINGFLLFLTKKRS